MKKIILFFLAIACLIISCKKVEDPQGYVKLEVAGPGDTVIVDYNTVLQYTASPIGLFSLSRPDAGEVDNYGKFTTGTTEGTFKLFIVNARAVTDTIFKTIVVTKHASIFNAMKLTGGYLFSFRHANASNGTDQFSSSVPNWWKSCDPLVARQITDPIGIKQSDSTGYAMKLMRLPFDTTMSSEFCRCKQTIQYFNLGLPNKEYAALTYYIYGDATRFTNTINLYASKRITTKNYLAVTHAGFPTVPNAGPLNDLNWGDCAVYKLNPNGAIPTYVKTIPVTDWVALARK